MKKTIAGFVAGQALQLLLMWVFDGVAYPGQRFGLCLGIGMLVLVGVMFGAWKEFAPKDRRSGRFDMEEAAPIPEDLKITQTNVERVPEKKHRSWGARVADAIEKGRKTEEPSVMEQKLSEVGTDA